jgi:hypothetical protein
MKENTNLKNQISVPKTYETIWNLTISNLSGPQFTLENLGNGMTTIFGSIDQLKLLILETEIQ